MERHAGFGRWALLILIPMLLLMFTAPPLLADAKTGEITLEDQAFINTIRKYRPDLADKLDRRLKRVEEQIKRQDLDDKQAERARKTAFEKALEEAKLAQKAAEQFGSVEQKAAAERTVDLLSIFEKWYLGQIEFGPERVFFEGVGIDEDEIIEINQKGLEVKVEIYRLEDERAEEERKRAEQEGSGEQGSLPPNGFLDGYAMLPGGPQVNIGFRAGEVDLPRRSFLKTRLNGVITDPAFGERDPTASFAGTALSVRIPYYEGQFGPKRVRFSVFGDMSTGSADLWESFELDAEGHQLGLFGVEGIMGPLGSGLITGEGFGDVTDGFHWLDYEEFTWRAGFAGGFNVFHSPVWLELSASFLYGETSEDSAYGGVTNLGTVHFEYSTGLDSIRRGVQLGSRLKYAFTPEFGAYAAATGQFTSDEADGDITLTSEFNGSPFPTEMQDMSESRFNVGGTLGAGLYVDVGPFQGFAGAEFETYNVPGVHLTGEEPAEIDFERRDSLSFMGGFSLELAPTVHSDVRLKRDIARLATLDNGLHLYRYRYLWSDTIHVGVMAQEVEAVVPEAVVRGLNGYLRVDYAQLGLEPMTWEQWTDRAAGGL